MNERSYPTSPLGCWVEGNPVSRAGPSFHRPLFESQIPCYKGSDQLCPGFQPCRSRLYLYSQRPEEAAKQQVKIYIKTDITAISKPCVKYGPNTEEKYHIIRVCDNQWDLNLWPEPCQRINQPWWSGLPWMAALHQQHQDWETWTWGHSQREQQTLWSAPPVPSRRSSPGSACSVRACAHGSHLKHRGSLCCYCQPHWLPKPKGVCLRAHGGGGSDEMIAYAQIER